MGACTFANMSTCILDGGIPIDIGQLAKAKPIQVVAGVRESIYCYQVIMAMVNFSHTAIQLVIGNTCPIFRFL